MNASKDYARAQTLCLILIAAVALGAALYWLRAMLIPFALAMFLAIALTPLVDLLSRRLKFPRTVAVLSSLALGIAILGLLAVVVSVSVGNMRENADEYGQRSQELYDKAIDSLPLARFGLTRDDVMGPLRDYSGKALGDLLTSLSNSLASVLSNGVLVVIFVCFLMIGRTAGRATGDVGLVEDNVKRYIIAKLFLSVATGVLVGLSLGAMNIPLATTFGLLAFLLNFIPSIGSILAVLLPIPIVLLSPDISTGRALLAIALPGAIEFVIGNVIEPRVIGNRLGLHPIAVLLALIFWGMLWGIIGMFLAVPMTIVARLLLEKNELTVPVANLLAGKLSTQPIASPETG